MEDTLYRCTVCGRVGTVGRCCGDETREPLNDLARRDQEKIKAQNLPKADAYSLLGDVRAKLLKELLTVFIDLLNEAKGYYHLYPNSHRATVEEYFEIEDKLIKKISEHFN